MFWNSDWHEWHPPAEFVQRLAQVPVGQQLPTQLMAADEGKGVWDDGVGEQEEQGGLIAHARKVKGDLRMTDEQLAGMMRPRTRSHTKSACTNAASARQACTSKTHARSQGSSSGSGSSSEEESSGADSSSSCSSEEGSSGEGSSDEE
eukprot:1161322-Pelagomonas_calceolata.AAC.4